MLVIDFETATNVGQELLFGCYRHYRCDWSIRSVACVGEGLVYADDLAERNPEGLDVLHSYVSDQVADTDLSISDADEGLRLWSRAAFVERIFYPLAYKSRGLVVGFNLPFDLSRLALGWGTARDAFAGGGLSLILWRWDDRGTLREQRYRPRIRVKTIDSKRHLINFGDTVDSGDEDGDSSSGRRPPFRGHFLDLRTLAFALTNSGYTLAGACEEFGVEHAKLDVEEHGIITRDYVGYNRRDVLATSELAMQLLDEYDRHPISPRYREPSDG
jgi:hypothetical protein